jgi:hypothetical protein
MPPHLPLIATCLALPLSLTFAELSPEERTRASELFATYRQTLESGDLDSAASAIKTLIDELPPQAAAVAHAEIVKEATTLIDTYRRAASSILEADSPRDRLRDPEVKRHRDTIAEILQVADESTQKRRLAEEGWPALTRLQEILLPDPLARIEADRNLGRGREKILVLLELGDALAEHARLPPGDDLRAQLTSSIPSGSGLEAIATTSDRRIIEENRKVAEQAQVPPTDALGVEDANRIRVLAGFPALSLDPLLCQASLNHSTDMAERGFFAHESPVPGRESFSDRAREVKTTTSAENIAMGQGTAEEANQGWFLSPGHFRNFFGDHARIGLGSYQRHWTQMFGR